MPTYFLEKNSFHDGYITAIDYCRETKSVKMNIVQLWSELELELPEGVNIQQDDLVEVELYVENVCNVSVLEDDYSDYDIIKVQYDSYEGYDVLLFALHRFGGYEEIVLKGKNMRVYAQIIKGGHI